MDLGFIADEQPPPADSAQMQPDFPFLPHPRAPHPFLPNLDLAPHSTPSLAALLSTTAFPPPAASSAPASAPPLASRAHNARNPHTSAPLPPLPSLGIPPAALPGHQHSPPAAPPASSPLHPAPFALPALFSLQQQPHQTATSLVHLFEDHSPSSPAFPLSAPTTLAQPVEHHPVELHWTMPFNPPDMERVAAARRTASRITAPQNNSPRQRHPDGSAAAHHAPSQTQEDQLRTAAAFNIHMARSVRQHRAWNASRRATPSNQPARSPATVAPTVLPAPSVVETQTATPTESRKRQRVSKLDSDVEEEKKPDTTVDDNEQNWCPICFEPWTSNGRHQLCCLPCGHLFGRQCIETWLKKRKVCPHCKQPMRGKKLILIYGAPTRLGVVDNGAIENLRVELEKKKKEQDKEKKDHEKTRSKLKDASRRLKQQTSVPSFGNPLAAASSVYQPLMMRSSLNSSHGALHRMMAPSRANPMPHSARAMSMPSGVPSLAPQPQNTRRSVFEMFSVATNGGSRALAFDDGGNILYSENRQAGQVTGPQKISRRPLINPSIHTQCRSDFSGRINDIVVCRNLQSQYRDHIALVTQSKGLNILNSSLEEVQSYATPAVPLSCWWMRSQPNILIAGLMNGFVCAYDIRMNSPEPLGSRKVQGHGSCAVHSLAEVPIFSAERSSVLLAATPTRIDAVAFGTFASTMSMEQVHRNGPYAQEVCVNLAVDDDQILLSSGHSIDSSPGFVGRHVVHQGIVPLLDEQAGMGDSSSVGGGTGGTLHFGRVLGDSSLQGHRMVSLFERAAIVRGDSYNSHGMIVMSPDGAGAHRSTRTWELTNNGGGAGTWNTAQIYPYSSEVGTMAVKSMSLSAQQVVRHRETRLRAIAGHLSDRSLQMIGVAMP